MKIIPGSRRHHSVARVGVFLIMAALIAGMGGAYYVGGGNTPLSQNLEIRTWYDLDAVRDNLDGNHILMNDLDSTTAGYTKLASPTANGGKGWEPIGFFEVSYAGGGCGGGVAVDWYDFTGTFDGQGYEIHDLFINRPDEDAGLFAFVGEGGAVKDIGVVNITVIGEDGVGGLVGSNYGTVSNSYSSGNVTGDEGVGGLVGTIGSSPGNVSNSYSTCNVIGNSSVGGLVGWNGFTVSNSYSSGNLTGYERVGGLVGYIHHGTVSVSYSSAKVTGSAQVGGLVGENFHSTVSNSFWDIQTSGQTTSDGGTGKSTAEMQDIATFSLAGWNIIAVALNETNPACIWNIVNNVTYPFLSWQP
jgi:hypothetical protein